MSDSNATTTGGHPNPTMWWKHRRRGYYFGILWAAFSTPAWVALEIFYPGIVEKTGVIVGWSYGIPATLIISYYGNTAIEEYVRHKTH